MILQFIKVFSIRSNRTLSYFYSSPKQYLSEGVDSAKLNFSFIFRMWLLILSSELGFGLEGDIHSFGAR